MAQSAEQPPGPAVDSAGRTVIDPTKNVDALVEAAVKRLDDLRTMENTWRDRSDAILAEHAHELRRAEAGRLDERLELRASYDEKLRDVESHRLDAIRAVDIAASQQAAKDAEIRASALAKQVSDSAEAMRNQVAAAATAAATSLGAALVPIQERLAELTRLQYEQQGQKAQVVEGRAEKSDRHAGWSVGAQLAAVGLAFFSLILLTVGTVVSVYIATH